ncbi:hypothetical protein UFB30_07905 [Jeotgalibacillus sp. HH7-29]|uniref:Type 4 fimbrial biogenesis protein PilX N-terminal domain-containing protein n=1 Tax=Jeotgalibacillus haloalkalitolerans TaxID=3104292 RepID=A0ABU5KLT8_9BACL|nr:hypothetical protein [Jeotgalibacillus sp. HH7-29]
MNEKGSILLPVLLFFILLLSASTVIASISVDRVRHAEMMSTYYQESAVEMWIQE